MKVLPPPGVPSKISYKNRTYEWGCTAGTGDQIYWRKGKGDGERLHVLVCKLTNGTHCG